jgi:hypothetical protein
VAPDIIQIFAVDNYRIISYFADGKITLFDMANNLEGVFAVLRDQDVFIKTLTILDNTAAWDISGKRDDSECLTIDPDALYNSEDVTDREIEFMIPCPN